MTKYLFSIFLFAATAQAKEYPLPIFFDVVGHGVELAPLTLQYDLQSTQGDSLKMGNLTVDGETFFVKLQQMKNMEPRLTRVLPKDEQNEWIFVLQWPENLMADGVLELISRTGRVLWTVKVDAKAQADWKEELEGWREDLARTRMSADEINKLPLFKTQYGLRDAENEDTPFWELEEPFRVCFSKQDSVGQTRLCSPQYEVSFNKNKIDLDLVPTTEAPPRVILMNENGPLSNEIEVALGKPVQFYAELRSGMSFEFLSVPQPVKIVDMVREKNGDMAQMTTEGDQPPLLKSVQINKEKVPEWVEWVGWQQTIGDFRKYWRTRISMKNPFFMVPGLGGGVFKQSVKITRLPREESRPFLHADVLKGTYIDGVPLKGRKPSQVHLSSKENSVSESKNDFVWNFAAKKKGTLNRSYLLVKDGEETYPSYQEIYKGYSGEISTRLSGILGAEGDTNRVRVTVTGELAFNYWFESVLGWYHPLFAHQRWGTSFKAYRTLTDLKISTRESTLSSYTADLKYRFSEGIWGRDESFGILGGLQDVSYDEFHAQMAGFGIFWARSMPRVFEPLMNWLKFLDYPKWVDLEFIHYPMSLTPDSKLGRAKIGNWALNFHGQVMFTENFFGEAGFGLKTYDLSHEVKTSGRVPNFSFTSSYGTMGLGYRF